MAATVLRYLEESAATYPQKPAVIDEHQQCTYQELRTTSRRIASALAPKVERGTPVMVYMEKGVDALTVFFGTLYAGSFYSLLNPELPKSRLEQIQSVLQAHIVVTSADLKDAAADIFPTAELLTVEELRKAEEDPAALADAQDAAIDTDPVYINFTSGSTGTPKGIVVCHRSIVDFIDCFTQLFHITERDIIANQAPFDFDVSVKDIYSALKTGATLVIVPRRLFSAPVQLLDFLCDHQVTTLIWAVSALCLVSTFHGLDYKTPTTVDKVLFSGEVMPLKHLRSWREHLPEALFVNLYGPTEITCNCTYHKLQPERGLRRRHPHRQAFPQRGRVPAGRAEPQDHPAGRHRRALRPRHRPGAGLLLRAGADGHPLRPEPVELLLSGADPTAPATWRGTMRTGNWCSAVEKISKSSTWDTASSWKKLSAPSPPLTGWNGAAACSTRRNPA